MSQYTVACNSFNETILEQTNKLENAMNKEDMKKYFYGFSKEAFVEKSPDYKLDSLNVNALKFVAKKIYKGYIDDPRNTDNAWIEAEIWNFHYGNEDKFDNLIPNVFFL